MTTKMLDQAIRRLLADASWQPQNISIEKITADGATQILHAHPQSVRVQLLEPVDVEAGAADAVITISLPEEEAAQIEGRATWNCDLESLDFSGDGWLGRGGRVGAWPNRLDLARYRAAQLQTTEIAESNAALLKLPKNE